jgi:tetratricopeptide (TPR) repeat protein
MRCPSCGTHHPPQYEQCVSCGQDFHLGDSDNAELAQAAPSKLSEGVDFEGAASTSSAKVAKASKREQAHFAVNRSGSIELDLDPDDESGEDSGRPGRRKEDRPKRRSQSVKPEIRSGMPGTSAILFLLTVLLIVAGASIFFLTKAPESDRLLDKGLSEIKNGQYAFAVETLTKASKTGKDNPKILLALARAYVGVEQVDKAWDCISQAKQMGQGVAEDPDLATQLANYYRMHNRFDKAVELLRPLAAANVPGKRAELADLDALWGDEELRDGKLTNALSLWEEVKTLNEGSRHTEADNRLATIYQRLAGKLIDDKKDTEALVYLNKLNAIAENPRNYETCADIYERTGQLELAIDQLRKAQRLAAHDDTVTHRLAALLTKRGKELLDAGELDTGYGYLQQARSVDPNSSVATVTLKGVNVDMQGGMPHIGGQVWNPTDLPINALIMKTDLVDIQDDHIIWTKESKVVDEYVPPLGPREGKHIDITSGTAARYDGSTEFKIYFDGKLYNSYLVGKKDKVQKAKTADSNPAPTDGKPAKAETPGADVAPQPGPPAATNPPTQGTSSEEKTMKDLGF